MNKLKRQDYLFVYMLILALILFVSGFFLGGSVIKAKYEDRLQKLSSDLAKNKKADEVKYTQTDFVSFYYGVLEPFNHLKKEHFSFLDRVKHSDLTFNYDEKSKELLNISTGALKKISETKIADSAPLLVEAKQDLIAALEYYQNSIEALLNKEPQPMEVQLFNGKWLEAQKKFYKAVYEWERMEGENPTGATVAEGSDFYNLSISSWNQLSLHSKNYALSILMEENKLILPVQPEDITIHLDALVRSGSVEQLGVTSVGKAIDFLIASNSIKNGDYLRDSELFYPNVKTPLIPLYLKH